MAIIRNGIAGTVSGKLGNTVMYTVLNKTVLRMTGKRRKVDSPKQLCSQRGMKVVNAFLKPLKPFIRIGFHAAAREAEMYAMNLAVSHHMKHSLKGEYPDLSIDYEKVLLAKGPLPGLEQPRLELENEGLSIRWESSMDPDAHPADQLMLLVYFPVLSEVCYNLYGARRMQGYDFLELPAKLKQHPMEIYCAMVSADRSRVSDSRHLILANKNS